MYGISKMLLTTRKTKKPGSRATTTSRPRVLARLPRYLSFPSSVSLNRSERARQATPTTVSTQNVPRQSATAKTAVPAIGATMGPMTNSTWMRASIFSRRSISKVSFTTAVHTVLMDPAPSAWTTRTAMSASMEGASAQETLPML